MKKVFEKGDIVYCIMASQIYEMRIRYIEKVKDMFDDDTDVVSYVTDIKDWDGKRIRFSADQLYRSCCDLFEDLVKNKRIVINDID